ncbi:hypothetical protein JV16_02971 [Anoxybacillus ayderensis]|uniref:Uncharacterized protein n=1 Tax=Anoxybacillus ayderensis TaxID=265546 RepID=A0A0D0HKS0_9BACL|nr:winged helix-turn-helix domain-containing protein [Anoxybacillus ayderensis]EPZ37551.1 hypothetical protein C289_2369 [Anoxybacillus ayderensis]KIP19892.1 hypothetical protein JV16_02971 [Anoxybacillus ayderensis]
MKFASKSEEIKFYVLEFLADGQEHSREEIKEYVMKRASHSDFTEGTFAGSLYDLAQRKKIESVRRGVYRINDIRNQDAHHKDYDPQKETLHDKCVAILNNTIKELRQTANEIDILDVSQEDLRLITQIKEVISSLQRHIQSFEK